VCFLCCCSSPPPVVFLSPAHRELVLSLSLSVVVFHIIVVRPSSPDRPSSDKRSQSESDGTADPMAGIVASTLRRRTFRQKSSVDSRGQQQLPSCETGGVNIAGTSTLSPHGLDGGGAGQAGGAQLGLGRTPSRSSSVRRKSLTSGRSPAAGTRRVYAPKGAKLFHEDFWPTCTNEAEQNLRAVKFDSFE